MEYNQHTYITILKETCDGLGIEGNFRLNNAKTIYILDFLEDKTIPQNILNNAINTYTHQQALELVLGVDWSLNLLL
jgi:hypothetical protein